MYYFLRGKSGIATAQGNFFFTIIFTCDVGEEGKRLRDMSVWSGKQQILKHFILLLHPHQVMELPVFS